MTAIVTRRKHLVIRWLGPDAWAQWDSFAERHTLGRLFHTSRWKAVIEESFPHIRGQCCTLQDGRRGTFTAGLPIYTVSSRLLGTRMVSVPFATLSDPLAESSAEFVRLLHEVRNGAVTSGIDRIEIRCTDFPLQPGSITEWSIQKGFKHHILSLDRAPSALLASTHPRAVRAMITRAVKSGLAYRSDTGEDSLHTFYRLFLATRRRLALPPIPFRFFRALHTHLVPSGTLSYGLVEKGATTVAEGLILKWRGTSTIDYLGDRVEQRRNGANQALYWGVICDAIREDRGYFSFGRTAADNEGLLRYKRRWGPHEHDLKTLVFPACQRAPSAYQQDSWKYNLVRRLCTLSPMPAYRFLGHFCYRHLG